MSTFLFLPVLTSRPSPWLTKSNACMHAGMHACSMPVDLAEFHATWKQLVGQKSALLCRIVFIMPFFWTCPSSLDLYFDKKNAKYGISLWPIFYFSSISLEYRFLLHVKFFVCSCLITFLLYDRFSLFHHLDIHPYH